MGQARARLERFREKHPNCCFCGGDSPTETIDHIPSAQMFFGKLRPKGLESPACKSCNHATGQEEQIAALVGRFDPDSTTLAERDEFIRIAQAVQNNRPDIWVEMAPTEEQLDQAARAAERQGHDADGGFNVGPRMHEAIQAFSFKLMCALHYAETGKIVPKSGGVFIRWFSNYDRLEGNIPPAIFKHMGPEKTLRQGAWSVEDQFSYVCRSAEDSDAAMYFAMFRQSFAVFGAVGHTEGTFSSVPDSHLLKPGRFIADLANAAT